jgi:FKBP-type peptidyl-prolyl cis-trans isomerase FkpA
MNNFLIIVAFLFLSTTDLAAAGNADTTFQFPDSSRVSGVLMQVKAQSISTRREVKAGIKTGDVQLFIEADKKETEIVFSFPKTAEVVATGIAVEKDGDHKLEWEYTLPANETVQLYLATASDSAANFTLYSGYIYLPAQNKWKLIGTCKQAGRWGFLKTATVFSSLHKKYPLALQTQQVWMQRTNGSFKELTATSAKPPVLAPFSDIDSTQQVAVDEQMIAQMIAAGTTDATKKGNGIYYTIMKEGAGRQVLVTDTVVVFYKGYLLRDGSVFDQTKSTPATFPLNRLIRGWQLGVPFCKVGGKIKLVIPSGLSYSIRTRAAKIPPNSTLVFEIEVLDVK